MPPPTDPTGRCRPRTPDQQPLPHASCGAAARRPQPRAAAGCAAAAAAAPRRTRRGSNAVAASSARCADRRPVAQSRQRQIRPASSATRKIRTQIDAFYSGRNYAPIWITDGKANARANAAIAYLGHVDADGLDPADYPVPNFATLQRRRRDLADAEIKLTMSVITYAHHASIGRVHWSRVSADIEYTETAPEPADVLAGIVGASDVAAALDAYEPQTPGYLALKAKLADIRAGKVDKGKPTIGNGPVLKVGMQDDRVPALRERLGVLGDGGTTYDKPLADAVKKFQQAAPDRGDRHAHRGDRRSAQRQAPDHATDIILANMERWRWMPHHFPDTYVHRQSAGLHAARDA